MAFYSTLKDPNLRMCPNEKCDNGVISTEGEEPSAKC